MVVLQLVQSQLRTMRAIYRQNTKVQLLERGLWQDFNKYNLSFSTTSSALFGESELDSVTYLFKERYVLRNKDTLKLAIYDLKAYLDGAEVKSGVIDALELQLSRDIKTKRIFIFRQKDAAHYVN